MPGRTHTASCVTRVLDRLHATIGLPETIVVDNGFIRPGKPIENAYVESFNGEFRDECLNEHWFVNLVDARG